MPTFQRPPLELAEIVRRHGPRIDEHLSGAQRRILRDIATCRTAALGGHVESCDHCHHQRIAYNSCRNRHCPRCQASAAARWMADRAKELLPVEYFHVVFTLPDTFNALALANKRIVYGVLFDAVAQTLLQVAANPKHLGARIGFMGILHTWGQNLSLHPHVHCIVPGGGLSGGGVSADGKWVNCRPGFFLPVRVLSKVFRGKFIELLKRARGRGLLVGADDDRRFDQLLNAAVRHDWVVYAKPPFGGAERVLHYLARYTHRVAISNHRLVSFKDDQVSFRWKDYAAGSKQKVMTVSADEFLRRFLIHVLPKGLVRIRHFGLFANRKRSASLRRCRFLLNVAEPPLQPAPTSQIKCPLCSELMLVIERFNILQLLAPPPRTAPIKPRLDSS